MSKQEVETFFPEYVFGFIFSDIQREICFARLQIGGGNLLAALGLLCYTEFMGSILRFSRNPKLKVRKRGQCANNFNAFFDILGQDYAKFRKSGVNVYDIFRCGMAHEYLVKKDCVIAMLKEKATCGIGQEEGGRYYFVVEKYFEDFISACHRLYNDLMAQPNPMLP